MAKQSAKRRAPQPKTGASIIGADYRRTHKPDAFAAALRAAVQGENGKLDLDRVKQLATENSVEFKWGHLNAGQQFMNLSNRLRAKLRRNEPVTLAGKAYTP